MHLSVLTWPHVPTQLCHRACLIRQEASASRAGPASAVATSTQPTVTPSRKGYNNLIGSEI